MIPYCAICHLPSGQHYNKGHKFTTDLLPLEKPIDIGELIRIDEAHVDSVIKKKNMGDVVPLEEMLGVTREKNTAYNDTQPSMKGHPMDKFKTFLKENRKTIIRRTLIGTAVVATVVVVGALYRNGAFADETVGELTVTEA